MQSPASICSDLRGGRKELFNSLCSLIDSTEEERLSALFTYAHPHLRSVLFASSRKSDLVERVYLSYRKFFECSDPIVAPSSAVQVLDDFSSFLFLCSSTKGVDRPWATFSDECCLAIARFMEAFFTSLNNSAIDIIYSTANLPLLSHVCFTLLQMSEHASSRAVRVHSLRCIERFAKPRHDSSSSKLLAASVAPLLPGISQALFRLVTGDIRVGSIVLSTTLDTWSAVLECVFSQKHEPLSFSLGATDSPQPQLFTSIWYSSTCPKNNQLISRAVDHILHIRAGSSTLTGNGLSVSFVNWLSCILLKCPALFEADSCSTFRDTVVSALIAVAACNDASESESLTDVCSITQSALHQFVQTNEPVQASSFHIPGEVINNRLLRKITTAALIDQINSLVTSTSPSLDESQLQKRLQTILGYLRVLDSESLSILVCSRDLFHRLCASFADLLCFGTHTVEILDETPLMHAVELTSCPQQPRGTHPPSLFPKSFEFFRNPRTLNLIQVVIGQLASQTQTFDLFMDTCRDLMFQTGSVYRNPALLLISAGLCGYLNNATVDWEQRRTDCIRVVSEYFESDLLQLPTSNATLGQQPFTSRSAENLLSINPRPEISSDSHDPRPNENPSLKQLKENVLSVCLVLELFCAASQLYSLQPTAYKTVPSDGAEDLLRICLLPCAARAAHPGLIGQTAKHCLQRVATYCAYSSVSELITKNADFLISNITLELHRIIFLGPTDGFSALPADLLTALISTGQVLQTLFEYANVEILPLLRPLVKQILACLDLTYEHHADLFLPGLKRLLLTCRELHQMQNEKARVLPISEHTATSTDCEVPEKRNWFQLTLQSVRSVVVDTRRLHHLHTGAEPAPNEQRWSYEGPSESSDNHEETNRLYPDHLHITEEVMLRCVHLLAAENPKSRLLSMDILIQGYLILSSERELLLPLVHKVWASLMSRFRDQHAVVVEKAFQLLTVLSDVAGDFLRPRASADVLPSLLLFLTRGASVSAGATDSYRYLTSYRVQKQLLLELGSLCSRLELSSEPLRSAISVLMLYLEDSQPRGLQQASEHSLGVLWCTDAGLVWTLLLEQFPPDYMTSRFGVPPSPELFPLEMKLPSEHNRLCINPDRLGDLLSRLCPYISIKTPDV